MSADDIQEFLDRLDLYGGRLEDWPPLARTAAETTLEVSSEARAHLAAMRRAEDALLLSRAVIHGGIGATAARAMQAPQIDRRQTFVRRLPWAAAGAVALLAGFYVGAVPREHNDTAADVAVALLDQSGDHDVW
jgi:hypothetical protein